jgi:hypothetical protein
MADRKSFADMKKAGRGTSAGFCPRTDGEPSQWQETTGI